jgi:hypothetical protein
LRRGFEVMIEIETTEPHLHRCDCCGGLTTTLVRFVHKDGVAHAVYYAAFTESHPDRGATSLVSIGPWGEGADPEDRSAFALHLWQNESGFNVSVVDGASSPWADKPILGKVQTREEALQHPLLSEVFHITDHMFTDDELLLSFFRSSRPDA